MSEQHVGSDFDEFLEEERLLEETEAVAAKRVLASQIAEAMEEQKLSKAAMARRMGTSRSTLDRLLDPAAPSVTLLTLQRAARVLDKRLRVELAEADAEDSSHGEPRRLAGPGPHEPAPDGHGLLACADLDAMKLVQRAKQGDSGAVGSILTRLAHHLRGETPLPREHAAFCSECLLELGRTLEAAADGFREAVMEAMGDLGDDPEAWAAFRRAVVQGKGPRLPEQGQSPHGGWSQKPSRDQLGRAFCQAFHISRRPGATSAPKGWMPYRAFPFRENKETVRTREDYFDKMSALLHYGESQTQAIKILQSAVKEPRSASTIRRWMNEEGFYDKIDPRVKELKILNFGFVVLALVEGGIDLEEACSMLGRTVVQGSCGLPDATVFLQPRTVKAAYELALKRIPQKSARTDA